MTARRWLSGVAFRTGQGRLFDEMKPCGKGQTGLWALVLLAMLAGCQKAPVAGVETARIDAGRCIRSELYFGSRKPDGTNVSVAEWNQFLEKELTAAFPDGLTIQVAQGQYRSKSGELQREETHVVTIIHPDEPRSATRIEQLRESYKKQFQQEAVLWISQPVQMH